MKHLVKELEKILETNIDSLTLPYKKGNSVRIGNYVVRSNKNTNLVYDIETKKVIHATFTKSAAFALAKTLAAKNNHSKIILELDKQIQKHYLDAVFYKNTIQKTSDSQKKEIRKIRLGISIDETKRAKKKLERFIFTSR